MIVYLKPLHCSKEYSTYQLYCSGCFKPIDIVTGDFLDWFRDEGKCEPYCWDCEGSEADMVPKQLLVDVDRFGNSREVLCVLGQKEKWGIAIDSREWGLGILRINARASACLLGHNSTRDNG